MIEMIEATAVKLPSYATLALLSLITLLIETLLVGTLLRFFAWSKDRNWNLLYNQYTMMETLTEHIRFSFQEDSLMYFLLLLLKAWLGYVFVFVAHVTLLMGVGATAYSLYRLWPICVW